MDDVVAKQRAAAQDAKAAAAAAAGSSGGGGGGGGGAFVWDLPVVEGYRLDAVKRDFHVGSGQLLTRAGLRGGGPLWRWLQAERFGVPRRQAGPSTHLTSLFGVSLGCRIGGRGARIRRPSSAAPPSGLPAPPTRPVLPHALFCLEFPTLRQQHPMPSVFDLI
jgi:hypothetical protein